MFYFRIQTDSYVSPSQQLIDQIEFAIASSQYPPGHRLPSTRQLAQITGLHRNTISKVYRQLEEKGLVESLTGSGIYVKAQGDEGQNHHYHFSEVYTAGEKIVRQSIDSLLQEGCNLEDIKQLFLKEIEWRLRCSAIVLVTVPKADIGAGELIVLELEQALLIPIQLVPLEELKAVLTEMPSATVVTSRYFVNTVWEMVSPDSTRVIPLDIYDYRTELEIVKKLPPNSSVGIVSLSTGILRVAEILLQSLRGDDITILTAQVNDSRKLSSLIHYSHVIMCDRNSYLQVKKTIQKMESDLIRIPKIICSNNYVGEKSIKTLKKELGI